MNPVSSASSITRNSVLRVAGPRDVVLLDIRAVCRHWIEARAGIMLTALDDTLFEMAVNSPISAQQNLYFDAMRDLRGVAESLRAALVRECMENIDRLFHGVALGGSAESQRIDVAACQPRARALREMSLKAGKLHHDTLTDLGELLNGLGGRQGLDAESFVTVWMALYCAGFEAATGALEIEAVALPLVLEAFEKHILGEQDELCARLAGVLVDAGVVPLFVEDGGDAGFSGATHRQRVLTRDLGGMFNAKADIDCCIELLCAELCSTDWLAEPLRLEIARLQPLLSAIAHSDKTLFSDCEHALASLINEIGVLALGWQSHDAGSDLLMERVTMTIDALLASELPAVERLQRSLAQWRAYATSELRRVQLTQRRTEQAEQAALLGAVASAAADDLLGGRIAARRLPGAANEFLHEGWRRVLVYAYLRGGIEGEEWQEGVGTLNGFIAHFEEKFYALPAALEERIRIRMAQAGIDPLRIEILLSGVNDALAQWEPIDGAEARRQPLFGDSASSERVSAATAVANQKAMDIARGTWFRFEGHGGAPLYGKFARYVGPAPALLFVDREGRKLACFNQAQFAAQLQLHRVVPLPEVAWFDAALDVSLKRIRSVRICAA